MSKRSRRKRKRDLSPKKRRRRILRRLIGIPLIIGILGVVGIYLFSSVPEPKSIATVQSARVLDANGRFVGRLSAQADRVSVPLEDMPQSLRDAVVAVEDHRFYSHKGISPVSIGRAAIMTALGRSRQGGSTITQQFVKNAYVGSQRSLYRKVKEAIISLKLEQQRSKDQILEDYLNTIYLGRGSYGVQAASKAYFGRHVKDLRVDQSALLAGIIRSPETYEPTREPELAKRRRDVALNLMVEHEYLDSEKAERLKAKRVIVRPRRVGGLAPHFMEEVRDQVESIIGANALYSGDITVEVTLDLEAQGVAEQEVARIYTDSDDPEVSLVAIDPSDGAIRAMIGAREYARLQLNLAHSKRQPGSTFKTAVLAEAIDSGIPASQLVDAPGRKVFDLPSGPWEVTTYDGRGHGRISLARATELSVNTSYAQLILDVGADAVAKRAEELGIGRKLKAFPSLALGTVEVSPVELASMYATIAARGMWHKPYAIGRVTGPGGKILYKHERISERVLDSDTADEVAWVLKGVIDQGTGISARLGREAAGKTGTTQNFRDAWFAGFTPDLAAVVWNGYADGKRTLRGVNGRNVTGGSFPAAIWRAYMKSGLRDTPPTRFTRPESVQKPSPSPTPSASPTGEGVATPVPGVTISTDGPSKGSPSPHSSDTRPSDTRPSDTVTTPAPEASLTPQGTSTPRETPTQEAAS